MQKPNKILIFFAIVLFSLFYGYTRLPRLHNDMVSTDSVYWHARSEKFLDGLHTKNYILTFQKYHPGVTLMWLVAGTAEVTSWLQHVSYAQVFDNFEGIEYYSKITIVTWLFILSLLLIYLLSKALKSFWLAYFSVLLFNFEPFYIGNARLIHHDAQISLYILIGFSLIYLFYEKLLESKFDYGKLILASFFLALAALSKTLFIGAFLFSIGVVGLMIIYHKKFTYLVKSISTFALSYMCFYVLLFPALWVDFVGVMNQIILESYDTSESGGHLQIMFGQVTRNPGVIFYLLLIITKTSLIGLVGLFIFSIKNFILQIWNLIKVPFKENLYSLNFLNFISIFYLVYFIVLWYFDKKVDRYVVSIYPYLAILAIYGWSYLIRFFQTKSISLIPIWFSIFILASYSIFYPLFSIFPHYLTYVNPVFGNADTSNKIIGQKLFGIGIFELREKIIKHFGDSTSVAINDIGPLSSIYPKGKVYNVLSEHPNSYKALVLGPNKDLPKDIKNDKNIKFKQIDSVYINGLEFWRIYKRVI